MYQTPFQHKYESNESQSLGTINEILLQMKTMNDHLAAIHNNLNFTVYRVE